MSEAIDILVVEDEINLAQGIVENLEAEGLTVRHIANGREALSAILANRYKLVTLDVMLPDLDGYSICEQVREQQNDTPILFLTAKGHVDERIEGLKAGGDDYLAKPFHLDELLLRVNAILRRRDWYDALPKNGTQMIEFAGNQIDLRTFQGRSWNGEAQSLTQKEAMILKFLAEHEGEPVSREAILEKVWGYDLYPSSRTIDNFIVRLRKRFEPEPDQPRHFHTLRGVGYRFTSGEESS